MTDINLQLLPETRKKIEVHSQGENTYVIIAGIFLLLVIGLYAGAYFYRSSIISDIQSIDNQLLSLEQQRDKVTEEKLLTLNSKLKVVTPLVSSHYFWSDALTKVQKLTQPQVQFKTMTSQISDKRLTIKAEASGYPVVAQQLSAFLNDPAFSNLVLNKILSLPTGKVELNFQTEFDPTRVLIRKQ